MSERALPPHERPYWWDTAPALRAEAAGLAAQEVRRKYDVVVVGAGYTGLSAARALARAGATVLVADREPPGWGASSRNGGQVLTGLKVDPHTLVSRYGEERARALFTASLGAIAHLEALIAAESIDCEYERTGHVQAAVKPAHFEAFCDEQALLARVFDHPVELVGREDQRAEIGTDSYYGLLKDERSGAINPARYVEGLTAAARRAGATVVGGLAVNRAARHGPGWTIAAARVGDGRTVTVEAGDILLATNGYTGPVTPALQRRFIPIGSYIIATEPLDRAVTARLLPRRRMAFDSKHVLHYFRLSRDGRLLFGGRAEFSPPSPEVTRRAAGVLRDAVTAIFPELGNVRIEYAWSGAVAFTRDELPHAGRLDDGAYYAGGYCGHGIAMATELGEIIGRRMGGELVEHPLMDDRFAPIPLYRGRPWFLPLVGAYYRLLDYVA